MACSKRVLRFLGWWFAEHRKLGGKWKGYKGYQKLRIWVCVDWAERPGERRKFCMEWWHQFYLYQLVCGSQWILRTKQLRWHRALCMDVCGREKLEMEWCTLRRTSTVYLWNRKLNFLVETRGPSCFTMFIWNLVYSYAAYYSFAASWLLPLIESGLRMLQYFFYVLRLQKKLQLAFFGVYWHRFVAFCMRLQLFERKKGYIHSETHKECA